MQARIMDATKRWLGYRGERCNVIDAHLLTVLMPTSNMVRAVIQFEDNFARVTIVKKNEFHTTNHYQIRYEDPDYLPHLHKLIQVD